jgi:hypothetical protein
MSKTIISKDDRKTIFIVGGTREAAYQELKRITSGNGVVRREFHDEVTLGGHPFMAIGGASEDVCFLRAAGFDVAIRTIEEAGISEEMWGRIRHVRSTNLLREKAS